MQVISDIHLEISGVMPVLKRTAPILALCGDIGAPKSDIYKEFLQYVSSTYEHVLVIAGNHEYYNAHSSMDEIKEIIQTTCDALPNVYFLDNSFKIINGIKFIGSTLWSNVSQVDKLVALQMNDYHRIRRKIISDNGYTRRKITPSYTTSLHKQNVQYLMKEVMESHINREKVVVLTHHLPTFRNIAPEYFGNPLNFAYATDLECMISKPIIAWCHGHSHYATSTVIHDVTVCSNPMGYPNEDTNYSHNHRIEL